ncbi:MAG: SAF domain-containing protein [Ilumatobacteraceae bacterium]
MRGRHRTPTSGDRARSGRFGARIRLFLARHPGTQWVVIGVLAIGTAVTVSAEIDESRAARAAWGTTVTVWVATRDIAEGESVVARRRSVPLGVRPPTAATDPVGRTARRPMGAGEIVTDADVDAPARSVPAGWLIAPVIESVPSGAGPGDRVRVVSDGFVIAPEAIVTGIDDGITLVAVPADVAPALPRQEGVALLLVP